jgi:hypothetical protein
MDPITILAACTAVWNGIKKASEFAQEAEGVWGQLSKYAGLADQLEQHITTAKNKPQKPKLFGNLEFGNDTQEAFNVFEAEHKLMQMEAEIKHEFLYGAFADLEGGYGSLDGYRKFLEMRRKIRADRIRMKQEQQDMQKKFWDDMFLYGGSSTVVVVGCLLLYMAIDFIFRYANDDLPTLRHQLMHRRKVETLSHSCPSSGRKSSTKFSQTQRPRPKRRPVLWRWRSGVS